MSYIRPLRIYTQICEALQEVNKLLSEFLQTELQTESVNMLHDISSYY